MKAKLNLIKRGDNWSEATPHVFHNGVWCKARTHAFLRNGWWGIPSRWDQATRPTGVPTGNNWRNCVISADSTYGADYDAYMAFTVDTSQSWCSTNSKGEHWIQIKMDVPLRNICMGLGNRQHSKYINGPTAGQILGSDNGVDWTPLLTFSGRDGATAEYYNSYECKNDKDQYTYIRLLITGNKVTSDRSYVAVGRLVFWGDTPIS